MASDEVFSEASPLSRFHGKNLLENIDLERLNNRKIFSLIKEDNFKIQKVVKINNPHLYGLCLLRKEEMACDGFGYVEVRRLYHATSPVRAESIARDNIDWRLTSRSRFGKGACFSSSPKYAHQYSSQDGAFVICSVLVKEWDHVSADYELNIPSDVYYDTIVGGNNDVVTVKFDDYTFYPMYIVYYTSDHSCHVKKVRRRY